MRIKKLFAAILLAAVSACNPHGSTPAQIKEDPMDIIRPQIINDTTLLYSSIAETDYAAWAVGTTYTIGDRRILGSPSATITVTIASPGVVTWASHGLANDTPIMFTTTGALPTGIVAGTLYYVRNAGTNTFELSLKKSGAGINTSGSQSGVHTGTAQVHRIFESLQANNVGKYPLISPTWWVAIGSTNRWAMLDGGVATQASAVSSLTVVLQGVGVVDAAELLNVSASTVRVVGASAQDEVVFTVTIASPAVFTKSVHGFVAGDKVTLRTTGALPTGLTALTTVYYVLYLTADTFNLSLTSGGAAINTSGTQSGVHYVARTFYDTTSVLSTVTALPKGIVWALRTSAVDNQWNSVTFGNNLFVAVANSGTGNRVMTSPDGITWTIRTSAADNAWISVTFGNNLFVAVANSGTGNRVMTSPDGITWTIRTSAADNAWTNVTFGNNLFVAVANSGTGNRVMTSPDGIVWTIRTSAADNNWNGVTFGNNLFVAVSTNGVGNRVMTSPNGITWTIQTSAADNTWTDVIYGNGLFVAVDYSGGVGNRVMTSPDGITWTIRTSAADNAWTSVIYGNGLFVVVALTGVGNRVMTSPDGIVWTIRTSAADNNWNSVAYGNGLFVAVADSGVVGSRVMTSPEVQSLDTFDILDLPTYSNARYTFTLEGADILIGEMVLGRQLSLGATQSGARVGIKDYSIKRTDDWGNATIVERPYSNKATFIVLMDNANIDYFKSVLAAYRATPIVWIGATQYGSTQLLGYYTDFSIEIAYPDHSLCSLEIEGLV